MNDFKVFEVKLLADYTVNQWFEHSVCWLRCVCCRENGSKIYEKKINKLKWINHVSWHFLFVNQWLTSFRKVGDRKKNKILQVSDGKL